MSESSTSGGEAGQPMLAAVCRGFGQPFTLEEVTLTEPGPEEVMVRLAATSICHSDVMFAEGAWGGNLPAIFGHEGAGVVEAVGSSVDGLMTGDHVVVTMLRSCGHCPCCARSLRGCCLHDFSQGGRRRIIDQRGEAIHQGLNTAAFAEWTTVHRSQIVHVDSDLPFDVGAVLACGVITGFGAVTNSAKMRPRSNVVVIGAGGVGLNCIQAARIGRAERIIAIDRTAGRLDAAKAFGATHGIDSSQDDARHMVFDLTDGQGADYVFVAVGVEAAIDSAFELLAVGGMAVLVGIPENGARTVFDPVGIASASQRIVGSKLGDTDIQRDIPILIDHYRAGRLKLDELLTHRFPFDRVNDAMAIAKSGSGLKTVIQLEKG